jgi:hypothetical protein
VSGPGGGPVSGPGGGPASGIFSAPYSWLFSGPPFSWLVSRISTWFFRSCCVP